MPLRTVSGGASLLTDDRHRRDSVVNVRGILRSALITETSETFQTAEIDQLGLLANLQALIGLSTDISESLLPLPPLASYSRTCWKLFPVAINLGQADCFDAYRDVLGVTVDVRMAFFFFNSQSDE